MYDGIQIVTFSPTHSSEKIARKVSSGLQSVWTNPLPVSEMNLTSYRHLSEVISDKTIVLKDKIVIFSAPVYAGRIPLLALQRFEDIFGVGSVAIPIVAYGNRDFDDALLELSDFLKEHGFTTAAAAAFIGEHSFSREKMPVAEGRPDASDIEKAFSFGQKIARKLVHITCFEDLEAPSIKGNYPYRERKPGTQNAPVCNPELCVRCGDCAELCPTGAIQVSQDIGAIADKTLCIQCCACFKSCPASALTLNSPFTEILYKNCSIRKEPEIFI